MAARRKPEPPPSRRERLFNRSTSRSGSFAMVQPTRQTIDVSSAALHTIGEARTKNRKHRRIQADTSWQVEAFDSVEKVGELGYVMNLKANTVAMCDFVIRKWDEETRTWVQPEENEDDAPERVMEAFVGPQGGQYDLKRRLAWHLSVAGESLMVGSTGDGQDGILWEFLSVAELKLGSDGQYKRYRDGGGAGELLPDEHYVARCWRSSPIYSDRADCEVKRILPIAKELIRLTQMIDAIASSRLPAKILVIPDEATFAGQEEDVGGDVDESDEALDPFVEEIFQHNSAAVTDPSSAARLTPLVMRVPMEMASPNSVFTIDLARDVDTWGAALRTESLQRLAQGLDSPPETMTGKSSLSHWTAWSVDADFLAKHVKPVGELMADFVTFAYLRPMLEAFEDMAPEESARWRIELDMASVSARQNEAEGAERLADIITDEARLKAHGFNLGDMADEETIMQRRIWQLVSTQPAQFAKLLSKLLGFEDFTEEDIAPSGPPAVPLPPAPAANDAGGTGAGPTSGAQRQTEPDMVPPDGLSARLVERLTVAADRDLIRALDRAGARVVSATQKDVTIRDRLKGPAARALTLIRDDELGRFSLTRESLLAGAWDALRSDASEWITEELTHRGVPMSAAHETATQIATVLCHELDAYALELTRSGATRHADNGLRIPGALIDRCLHAALIAT
jgi:hypothetical protein